MILEEGYVIRDGSLPTSPELVTLPRRTQAVRKANKLVDRGQVTLATVWATLRLDNGRKQKRKAGT